MLIPALLACLLLPQGQGVQNQGVKVQARNQDSKSSFAQSLPAKRTFFVQEFPSPKRILANRGEILLFKVLDDLTVRGLLNSIGEDDGDWSRFLAHRPWISEVLSGFDQGLGFSLIFPPKKNTSPISTLLGSSSDREWIRKQPGKIKRMLTPDPEMVADQDKRKFSSYQKMLGNTPVVVDILRLQGNVVRGPWRFNESRNDAVLLAVRNRRFGAVIGSEWSPKLIKEPLQLDVLGSSLRLRGAGLSGDQMLMLPPISFEGEILGRQLLRWKRIIEDRDRTHEGEYKEMAKFGLDRFLGARSVIGVQGGKLVEELEFHFEKSSGAGAAVSPFEVFSPSDGGLARAAASLPDNTVAALHMTLDGNRLQSFLEELTKLMYMPEARRLAFFHYLRMMLGCVESTSKPKAQEPLPEKLALTAFVLPPEQSFFPEFLIAVDVGDRKVDRKGILTRVAGDLSDSFGGDRSKLSSYVKSLGQGEDAIPYVKLSRLLQSEGSVRGRNLVLGGRYLALGQMGSSLIYGTHPRAIRKLKLSIANGETLASRKGFQARFPEATRNPIGLYLDAENLGEAAKLGLKVVNSAALQGALLALLKRAKGSSKQYIPNWASLIKMIDDHSIVGEETEYGLRLVFKGNGLLSPSMWAAIAYAMDTVNGLAPMLPATAKKK